MEIKGDDSDSEWPASPMQVLEDAVRAAGAALHNVYASTLNFPSSSPDSLGHRRSRSEVINSFHRRTNSIQRLKSHMQRALRLGGHPHEHCSSPCFDPEILADQKRQWYEGHSKTMDYSRYKEPTSLFEHFVIVGLRPDTSLEVFEDAFARRRECELGMEKSDLLDSRTLKNWRPSLPKMEPQILFRYPPEKKLAIRSNDLASFCFPSGVQACVVQKTPSLSDLNEIVYGQEHLSRDDLSFIFSLKVADNATLYGVCLHVQEFVQSAPAIRRVSSPAPESSVYFSRFLASAPRCYCVLSRVPFFELHYEMLNSIVMQGRLNRINYFVSELDQTDHSPSTSKSNESENSNSPHRVTVEECKASAVATDCPVAPDAGIVLDNVVKLSSPGCKISSPGSVTFKWKASAVSSDCPVAPDAGIVLDNEVKLSSLRCKTSSPGSVTSEWKAPSVSSDCPVAPGAGIVLDDDEVKLSSLRCKTSSPGIFTSEWKAPAVPSDCPVAPDAGIVLDDDEVKLSSLICRTSSPGSVTSEWKASAVSNDCPAAPDAGIVLDHVIKLPSLRCKTSCSGSVTFREASDHNQMRASDKDGGKYMSHLVNDGHDLSENHSETEERIQRVHEDGLTSDVGECICLEDQHLEHVESCESCSSERSMVSDDDDDIFCRNGTYDGDEMTLEWAKENKKDLLQIVGNYYSLPLQPRGNEIVFHPLEHLQAIHYTRIPLSALQTTEEHLDLELEDPKRASQVILQLAAAEEAAALSRWTTATMCRILSLEKVLALITGVLLEKQVIVVCPNLGVLSAVVLSLIPIIRPFEWQSLFLPILPEKMLDFLDAPVPFIVGIQQELANSKMKTSNIVHVNVVKDQVKMSNLPVLPRYKELMSKLEPVHAKLSREGSRARKHPIYRCNEVQAEAATEFLLVMRNYLESLCSDLRSYSITNVQSGNDRVSVLLKDSFIESFERRDQPFIKLFVDTQLFTVLSDSRL